MEIRQSKVTKFLKFRQHKTDNCACAIVVSRHEVLDVLLAEFPSRIA